MALRPRTSKSMAAWSLSHVVELRRRALSLCDGAPRIPRHARNHPGRTACEWLRGHRVHPAGRRHSLPPGVRRSDKGGTSLDGGSRRFAPTRFPRVASHQPGASEACRHHGGRRGSGAPAARLRLVSIHAPARRATKNTTRTPGLTLCFNPRPRTEGDASSSRSEPYAACFNPRPRTEGDSASRSPSPISSSFNPRPRTEGDLSLANTNIAHYKFQSTPPHGGRRERRQPAGDLRQVSIHAPARRATTGRRPYRACGSSFNPRPRTEGDGRPVERDDLLLVSIHAPARRATLFAGRRLVDARVSIHAPARRATTRACWTPVTGNVSIHAPARRATRLQNGRHDRARVSIHAPHGGRQEGRPPAAGGDPVSIHAPARRATAGEGK